MEMQMVYETTLQYTIEKVAATKNNNTMHSSWSASQSQMGLCPSNYCWTKTTHL